MKTLDIGAWGEQTAREYLVNKGYRFITANWLTRGGEIDLVMQDRGTRVFVEVRLRRPTSFGEGLDTVASQKQRKLIRTVKLYQQQERWWGDVRFDVISIISEPGEAPQIEHIEDAFTA